MTNGKSDSEPEWYGVDAAFWYRLERGAKAHFAAIRAEGGRDRLHVLPSHEVLTYRVTGMKVDGDTDLHDITIEFHRNPPYPTGRLAPEDYPRITTSVDRKCHHQHAKQGLFRGGLCLWKWDAPCDERWTSDRPLYELFEMVRRHLLMEEYYRRYKRWPMADIPHRSGRVA
jgi:hypothetical protein